MKKSILKIWRAPSSIARKIEAMWIMFLWSQSFGKNKNKKL